MGYYNDTGEMVFAYGYDGAYLGNYNKKTKQTISASGAIVQQNGIEGLGFLIVNHFKHT